MDFSKKIKELIASNKWKEVFNHLSMTDCSEGLKNDLIQSRQRFETTQKSYLDQLIDRDQYNKEISHLIKSVFHLIDAHKQEAAIKNELTSYYNYGEHPNGDTALYDGAYRRNVDPHEVKHWKDYFENSEYNKAQCLKALNAIREWEKFQDQPRFRAWGTTKQARDGAKWSRNRFWGLFNFRPKQNKWVWLAWDSEQSKLVFVKEVQPNCSKTEKIKRLNWEKAIYSKISVQSTSEQLHKATSGVVSLIDHGEFWFATSFATYGNLHWQLFESNRISGLSNGKLHPHERVQKDIFKKLPVDAFAPQNWPMVRNLFVQLADTLAILHEAKHIHRDIHPANLLLNDFNIDTQSVNALICDFDRTRINDGPCPDFLKLEGQELCAPERYRYYDNFNQEEADEYHGLPACDVYSLAATLVIGLLSREVKDHEHRLRILNEQTEWPKKLKKLLLEAMSGNPKLRPSATAFSERLKTIRWPNPQQKMQQKRMVQIFSSAASILLVFLFANAFQPKLDKLDPDCQHYECLGGEITGDLTLTADHDYLLKESLYVLNGTLNIEAGTKIYGKRGAFIIIGPDAKINARGAAFNPIRFTSWNARPDSDTRPEAGDWAGVIIMGKAPVSGDNNLEFCDWLDNREDPRCSFGGDDPHHSSGVFRYVRIEYAGTIIHKDQEVNGLTIAGVGDQTVLEYILISHVIDDCFEFFGGTVNANHLICKEPGDDAFDFENGYSGNLRYLLMEGGPNYSQDSNRKEGGSRSGIEGSASDDNDTPGPAISNVTLYSKHYFENNKALKPINFDNDIRPIVKNLLIISTIDERSRALSVIDSLDLNLADSLPIINHKALSDIDFNWDNKGIKPTSLISRASNHSKNDQEDYIGAFKSKDDQWDKSFEPRAAQ